MSQLLREGTEYFQVVFTIPDKLSSLVLGNRRPLYRLLFRSAASALRRSLRDECEMQAALTMVLHTWNQRLRHHPHIHALVPGSGPPLDGKRWVPCRMTQATRRKPARPFLVDNTELGRRFRDSYVRGVRRLIQAGLLKIDDLAKINTILDEVQACDGVVYIQPPPKDTSDPEDVLKYLARYMTAVVGCVGGTLVTVYRLLQPHVCPAVSLDLHGTSHHRRNCQTPHHLEGKLGKPTRQ